MNYPCQGLNWGDACARHRVPLGRQRHRTLCDLCGREGHAAAACGLLSAALAAQTDEQRAAVAAAQAEAKPLLLLSLPTFREYLLHTLRPEALGVTAAPAGVGGSGSSGSGSSGSGGGGGGGGVDGSHAPDGAADDCDADYCCGDDGDGSVDGWWDSERVLDDFVFVTFLVGNDFLPPLPTLSIATGGLDLALDTYRACRRGLGGYLVREGSVQRGPLAGFFAALAKEEEVRAPIASYPRRAEST